MLKTFSKSLRKNLVARKKKVTPHPIKRLLKTLRVTDTYSISIAFPLFARLLPPLCGEEQEDSYPLSAERSKRTLTPSLRRGARGLLPPLCGEEQEDSYPLSAERSKRTLTPSLRRGARGLLGWRFEATDMNIVILKSSGCGCLS